MTPKEWSECIVQDDRFASHQDVADMRSSIAEAITDSVSEAVAKALGDLDTDHKIKFALALAEVKGRAASIKARALGIVTAGGPQASLHEQILALPCD